MESLLTLEVTGDRAVTTIRCAGEIDLSTSDQLRQCLLSVSGNVLLDFAAVTFLDSSGIAALVSARKRLRAAGGDLSICRAHDVPRKAMELVGLAEFLAD